MYELKKIIHTIQYCKCYCIAWEPEVSLPYCSVVV